MLCQLDMLCQLFFMNINQKQDLMWVKAFLKQKYSCLMPSAIKQKKGKIDLTEMSPPIGPLLLLYLPCGQRLASIKSNICATSAL